MGRMEGRLSVGNESDLSQKVGERWILGNRANAANVARLLGSRGTASDDAVLAY